MKELYIIKKGSKHHEQKEKEYECGEDGCLQYEREASNFMSGKFRDYVRKHGYHFTDDLAEYVSGMMENRNGKEHTWTALQVSKSMINLGWEIPENITSGDLTYLANMYYSDLYDDPLKDETSCLKSAYRIATDKDGYDGMIFLRWCSDAIGKGLQIDWDKFI